MASDSPTVVLFDVDSNPVGIIYDGTVYRLQVESSILGQTSDGYSIPIKANSNGELIIDNSTFLSRTNTLGQKTMANSMPVVLASNQSAIPVAVIDGGAVTQSKTAYDIGDTVIYIGTAELASSTSSAVWLIKRITLVDGTPTFTEWSSTSAIWDDRAIETYQ